MSSKPRNRIPLNGGWHCEPGEGHIPPSIWSRVVPVPGLIDLASPSYRWQDAQYHWYRKIFTVDETMRSAFVSICIEQAMFGTEVRLNGTTIGSDIACYTSQEYNCSDSIRYGKENELLVRVGLKATLPRESAVGKDQERQEFIPGIWGDVYLTFCGYPRVKLIQVIPRIETAIAEVNIWIENGSENNSHGTISAMVAEKSTGRSVSIVTEQYTSLQPHNERKVTLVIPIPDFTFWSPEQPFLYEVQVSITSPVGTTDEAKVTFGMREFTVKGSDFYLNGKRIFLRGGNIAFHRFLSDSDRGTLPWNLAWVKKFLIDIPKAHHFNFFRFHLGQAYNRWYDIADQYGMLLQNEWQFWTTTGSKDQITREFTRGLQDNWNHPSIIIWDPINESTDYVVQREIVPEMKKLDPTRPWESVDFTEQHPYIYSLGPVLVNERFGFTDSLDAIEYSSTPSMVNEFLWWWLDNKNNPTLLTKEVLERWLGASFTEKELKERQLFLAQELVELFRRMRVDAIQPFVYLSNNAGPTGNWFTGNIAELKPKPVLKTLRNAFSPFGISVELWDRHFIPDEERTIRIFIVNDEPVERNGIVNCSIEEIGKKKVICSTIRIDVEPSGCTIIPVGVQMPEKEGEYYLHAELKSAKGKKLATSRKIIHVLAAPPKPAASVMNNVGVFGSGAELLEYLGAEHELKDFSQAAGLSLIILAEGLLRDPRFRSQQAFIQKFLENGGRIILIEPEYGIAGEKIITITSDISLRIQRRADVDKGGYDSYVFATDHNHPLWSGIEPGHLTMFNGGFGGEIVSQHDVIPSCEFQIFARCGLQLKVPAVFEFPAGRGKVIVSRLQLRGRLMTGRGGSGFYDRRADPVLQRYLSNLIAYALQ